VRSAGVVNSHRQPWRGTLSLSTVQDRTDPADMESMLKKCVLTLVLAWRVGAAVEPEVSFSGPACLGWGECATHPGAPLVRFALLSLLVPRNLSRKERPSDLLLHKSLHCVRERWPHRKILKTPPVFPPTGRANCRLRARADLKIALSLPGNTPGRFPIPKNVACFAGPATSVLATRQMGLRPDPALRWFFTISGSRRDKGFS